LLGGGSGEGSLEVGRNLSYSGLKMVRYGPAILAVVLFS
jgi:hypothetical protein